MGNQAQEFQGAGTGIAKLVDLAGWNKHGAARAERMFFITLQHNAVPFQHEYFMFMAVGMLWGMSAWA